MKKIKLLFAIILFSGFAFSQTPYTRAALISELNAKINANHANKITGDTLNHVLKHFLYSFCNLVSDSCGTNAGENFANTDLEFTGNRNHDLMNYYLRIKNGNIKLGESGDTDTLTIEDKIQIPRNATNGYVLTCDTDSMATWQPPAGAPQNGLVSGGIVTWLFDYIYSISAATYYINGTLYSSPAVLDTISAADVSDDRIDLFVLTTSSTETIVEGTPSTPAVSPDYDANTQLQIAFATIPAGTTEPDDIQQEWIYQENTEWTTSVSAGTIVASSTNNPFAGSKDVEGTSVANTTSITFTSVAPPTMSAYSILNFMIRSKANWSTSKKFSIRFYNGTTAIGNSIPFGSGSYGFVSNQTTAYQSISIPLGDFGNISTATALKISQSNTSGTIGWYLDNIQLQNSASVAALTGQNFANADLTFTGNRFHNLNNKTLFIFNGEKVRILMGDTNFVNAATEIILDTNQFSIYQQQNANNYSFIQGTPNTPLLLQRSNGIHTAEIDLDTSGRVSVSPFIWLPQSSGTGTLISGVDTVFSSYVTAASIFQVSYYKGTISSPGSIYEDATLRSAGNYFIIKSSSGTDASTYSWMFTEN